MGSAPDIRRLQRIARLNALFSWDFHQSVQDPLDLESLEPQEPVFVAPEEITEELDLAYPDLLKDIVPHIEEFDGLIFKFAPKHDLAHFNKVDLAILRQGLYELVYTSTPAAVVIDEAIELAKLYGSSETASFVHGVLGNIADERRKEKEQSKETTHES